MSRLNLLLYPRTPPTVFGRPPAAFALGFNLCGLADNLTVASVATLDGYLAYFQLHGFKNVRLPIPWQRVQPVSNGPLDPTYLGVVLGTIDAAAAPSQVQAFANDDAAYSARLCRLLHDAGLRHRSLFALLAIPDCAKHQNRGAEHG